MKIFYHKKEKNLFLSLKRKKGFKVFKLTKKTKKIFHLKDKKIF